MWYVDIIRDGEYIHCSTHDNREDAVGAYNDFRQSYGDEYIVTITYDEE
jgi:hypothetical protein